MVSQIYFLKCLQISFTQIKHTYNDSAAVNKLPVIWNSISISQKKKNEREKSIRACPGDPSGLHNKIQSQSLGCRLESQWAEHWKHGISECRSLSASVETRRPSRGARGWPGWAHGGVSLSFPYWVLSPLHPGAMVLLWRFEEHTQHI